MTWNRWLRKLAYECLAGCLAVLLLTTPAMAQDTSVDAPDLPAALTEAEIDALVARLDDDGVRRLLIAQLQGEAEAQEAAAVPEESFVAAMDRDSIVLRERIGEVIATRGDGPQVVGDIWRDVTANGTLAFLLAVAVLIIAGAVVEGVFRRATADVRRRVDEAPAESLMDKFCYLLLRGVLDLFSTAAFAVGGFGAFVVVQSHPAARRVVATYLLLYVVVRLLSVVTRFFLSPRAPQLRLVGLDTPAALALHRWALWILGIGAFGLTTLGLLMARGVSAETGIVHRGLITGIMVVLIIILIWRRRYQVAQWMRGGITGEEARKSDQPSIRLRSQMADLWPILATVYLVGVWLVNMVGLLLDRGAGPVPVLLSLAVLVILPAVDGGIGALLRRVFSVMVTGEDGVERREVDAHNLQSIAGIRRGIRILLVLLTAAALAAVWGFDFASAADNPIIARVAEPIFNTVVIVVLGYVAWHLFRSAIDRRLDAEGGEPGHEADAEAEEGGGDPATRLQTLLPLFRKFMIGVLVVMVVLSVLASFGVNIAPLLAGAGVVGIAVGFGAQALVRDIFSGLFFLVDDAFRVGEYIEIDDKLMGTVEDISVRSMKLRHHRGAMHILPFGELRSITNRSRGWVIDKLEMRVPYDTDVEQVRKIIKRIGIEMMEDPDLGPRMIAPLKSQGVYQLEDSAMILRAKYTSKPRGRAKIRREAQIRIKKAFDEAGIEFAHKQVTVHVPEGGGGAAAGAAAAAALQQMEEETAKP